jgi:putative membrane protein
MLHLVVKLVVVALSVLLAARIVPGIRVRSFASALFFAVVLGVLNVFLKPVLIFLSIPFVILSLGLFLLIINAFLYWLADKLVEGVEIDGFGACVLGSLITTGVTMLLHLR